MSLSPQSLRDRPHTTEKGVVAIAEVAREEARLLRAAPDSDPRLLAEAVAFRDAANGVLDAMDEMAAAVYGAPDALSRRVAGERLDDATTSLGRHVRLREARLFGSPAEAESLRTVFSADAVNAKPGSDADKAADRAATFINRLDTLRTSALDPADFSPPAPVQEQVADVLAAAEAAGFATGAGPDDLRVARYLMDVERKVLTTENRAATDQYASEEFGVPGLWSRIDLSGTEVRETETRMMAALNHLDPALAGQVADRQQRSLAAAVRHIPPLSGTLDKGPLPARERRLAERYQHVRDPYRDRTGAFRSHLPRMNPATVRAFAEGKPARAASGGGPRSTRTAPQPGRSDRPKL